MTGMRRLGLLFLLVLTFLAGVLLGHVNQWWSGLGSFKSTIIRLSPDETMLADLGEPQVLFNPDRYVSIRLMKLHDRKWSVIHHSGDEGRPEGTERLIWSKDGKWLLVVGRHFFVKEDLFLDNGDQLYFLHHVPSGKSWLNSASETQLPVLNADAIRGIEFTEPVTLKAR
jgi:hypothetical protein